MSLTTERQTGIHTARTSPVLVVAVNRTGVVVPRLDGPPEFFSGHGRPFFDTAARYVDLDRPGLDLVLRLAADDAASVAEAIDAVATRFGLDGDGRGRLQDVAARLTEAGLLLDDTADDDVALATDPPIAPMVSWQPDRGLQVTAERATGAGAPTEATDATDVPIVTPVPVSFRVGGAGLELMDHEGRVRAVVSPDEVFVAAAFVESRSVDAAHQAMVEADADRAPSREAFDAAVARLLDLGVCRRHDVQPKETMRDALKRHFEAFHESDLAVHAALEAERDHERRTGVRRALVVPMDVDEIPPLSLGMVVAYAQAYRDGALGDRVAFAPLWNTTANRLPDLLEPFGDWPTIFLFSHYTWTRERNLQMAALVKERLPNAITIHGGPSAPKYEGDAEQWFERFPQVDVAVRGEGELTLAEALDALASAWPGPSGPADLSSLAPVAGLTYRTDDGVHRTADRDRIADLDTVPSPYLTGIFDHLKRFRAPSLILETNRGCPYGCTFCDWGSATLSRIRKFDLDRVKAEMEWAAQRHLEFFMVADANFGMLDRDVEIVEWAVELKHRYGAPSEFWVNYAKNKVGNLAKIVEILREGGIGTQCVASVQSFDPVVLKTIRRSNIKIERYDALTDEFRRGDLPLETDVMIGLPGATVATFRNDLQGAIDRELQVRALPLQLLVNSPMNDPEYRREHGIVAAPDELVQETNTYTRDDWVEMMATRRFFYFAERNGILRQIATYVRAETGMREIDFYQRVRDRAADRRRWPHLAYLVFVAPDEYLPPGSWWPVVAELGVLLTDELGVADDDALRTVLGVQHALMPDRNRRFPLVLDLPHDFAAWHGQALDAKLAHTDGTWPDFATPLRDYPPARFVIEDHDNGCELLPGQGSADAFVDVAWELDSPIVRPKKPRERVN